MEVRDSKGKDTDRTWDRSCRGEKGELINRNGWGAAFLVENGPLFGKGVEFHLPDLVGWLAETVYYSSCKRFQFVFATF